MNTGKEVYLSFYEWLMKFKGVDHRFGDLANDADQDKNFPRRSDSCDEIREYVECKTSSRDVLDTLEMALHVFSDDMHNPVNLKPHLVSLNAQELGVISDALDLYAAGQDDEDGEYFNEIREKIRKPLEEAH